MGRRKGGRERERREERGEDEQGDRGEGQWRREEAYGVLGIGEGQRRQYSNEVSCAQRFFRVLT